MKNEFDGALSAAFHVTSFISPRNKFVYGLQIVIPGLAVCNVSLNVC